MCNRCLCYQLPSDRRHTRSTSFLPCGLATVGEQALRCLQHPPPPSKGVNVGSGINDTLAVAVVRPIVVPAYVRYPPPPLLTARADAAGTTARHSPPSPSRPATATSSLLSAPPHETRSAGAEGRGEHSREDGSAAARCRCRCRCGRRSRTRTRPMATDPVAGPPCSCCAAGHAERIIRIRIFREAGARPLSNARARVPPRSIDSSPTHAVRSTTSSRCTRAPLPPAARVLSDPYASVPMHPTSPASDARFAAHQRRSPRPPF